MYSVVLVCAGSGSRTELGYNKMFYKINYLTVYEKVVKVFLEDDLCKQIIVVCKDEEIELFKQLEQSSIIEYCVGGKERQDSVYSGLNLVKQSIVLIHDGARPFLSKKSLNDIVSCMNDSKAAVLMVPCIDTIKVVQNECVVETLPRNTLMMAQTPQAFQIDVIKQAYSKAMNSNVQVTDDCSVVEMFSDVCIKIVVGDYKNNKITTPKDLI